MHWALVLVLLGFSIGASVDWRKKKGILPPMHNQGSIGSSELFDVLDVLESYHAIHTGQMIRLSGQELMDCCHIEGHPSGELLANPFGCIGKLGGLCSETSYPYTNRSETCKSSSCEPVFKIKGGVSVDPPGDEAALAAAVFMEPVLAAIDAGLQSFEMYREGIYSDKNCSSIHLDHTVLVVGYGSTGDDDYWIIRNSWGSEWGQGGYMYLARNRGNMCGIASMAAYPIA